MSGPKALRPYVLRQWRALLGAGASTGVVAAAELAKPWPLALIVDHLLDQRQAPFTLDGDDVRVLVLIGALILAIAIAESAATYFSNLWMQSAGERITHELRVAVYDHLQRLSLAFHQRTHKGDLLTRVTEDVNDMGELFSDTLGEMLQSALLALGMTVVLLLIDPVLALISLTTAPLLVVISFFFRRKVRERARRQRHHEGDLASVANEALSAMAVVKAFGAEDMESERVRSRSEQRMGVGVEVARLQARFDGTVGVLRAFATALVTVFGVFRVAKGELSAGDLIVFVSYTRKASSPMRSFAREASKLTAAMARAERIAEILSTDDVIEDKPGAYKGPRARGEIELQHVSFVYGDERAALHDVSLTLPAGRRLALTGPSGAGKSTLSALVARFYDPTEGAVIIDGRDARDCSPGLAARSDRGRPAGHGPLLRQRPREHRLRHGRHRARHRRGRQGGRGARVHRGPPRGLRDRARPPGRGPVRRPAAAHRDRPHAAAQPAGDHPRRAHHLAGQGERGPGARRPRPPDARSHLPARHALPAARPDRGPDHRTRSRTDRPDGGQRWLGQWSQAAPASSGATSSRPCSQTGTRCWASTASTTTTRAPTSART